MNTNIKIISGAVAGLLVGGAGAYFITKSRLEQKYADLAQQDIDAMKDHYAILRKTDVYSTPEKAVADRLGEEYVETVKKLGYAENTVAGAAFVRNFVLDELAETEVEDPEEDGPMQDGKNAGGVVSVNVFDLPEPDQDDVRDPDLPYVISIDEFMEHDVITPGDVEYEKISVRYFAEDDVLVDERESVIDDIDGLIGSVSTGKFGSKSKDKNIVYIRNERLQSDFEVILDKRSYTEVILGIAPEKERPQKFRETD